jgi:hypothetical protein
MSDPLEEIFEFAGKAAGIIARDLQEISKPLGRAFRRGWRRAWEDKPTQAAEAQASSHAPESA